MTLRAGKKADNLPTILPEAVADAHPVLRVIRPTMDFYAHRYHRLEMLTPCTLPASGRGILVCNHISGLDPIVLTSATKRLISWMMAREYYEVPLLKWLYRVGQCIPVERSGKDLAATRMALRMLEGGYIVGIFPEGRIALHGEVLPFQTGVAMLALRGEAPVYPAYIDGTMYNLDMIESYFLPQEARIAFGPAVEFKRTGSSRELLEGATESIHKAVLELRDRYFRPPSGR